MAGFLPDSTSRMASLSWPRQTSTFFFGRIGSSRSRRASGAFAGPGVGTRLLQAAGVREADPLRDDSIFWTATAWSCSCCLRSPSWAGAAGVNAPANRAGAGR